MIYIIGILFLILFTAINFYIGVRGWEFFKIILPFANIYVYWTLFVLVVLSFFIGRLGRKFFSYSIDKFFNLIGAYWLAALFYFFISIVFINIIKIIIKITEIRFYYRSANFNISLITGVLTIIFVAIFLIYGTYNANHTKIVKYDININKKPVGLKELNIVMVSDIHLGSIVGNKRLDEMVVAINKLHPDIVILAGDIIDDDINPFKVENMGEDFKKIKSKYGIYAVLGNHEYIGGNIDEIEAAYKSANIKLLKDRVEKINDSFYVLGRDDVSEDRYSGRKRADISQIISGCDKSLPIIAIDHQPVKLQEPETAGVDLQFSGHTHGGQIFPISLITRKIFEIDWGYLKKGNLNVIVSCGYGTWGPPIRIGTNSEIVSVHAKFL